MNYYIKNIQINKVIHFKIHIKLKINHKNKNKINKILINKSPNSNNNKIIKQINNIQLNN